MLGNFRALPTEKREQGDCPLPFAKLAMDRLQELEEKEISLEVVADDLRVYGPRVGVDDSLPELPLQKLYGCVVCDPGGIGIGVADPFRMGKAVEPDDRVLDRVLNQVLATGKHLASAPAKYCELNRWA